MSRPCQSFYMAISCLSKVLYHQHKHKFRPENSNPVWKQWCQSHHGNCSYKLCLFVHSLLPLSMWHSSVISFCHNAQGINALVPRTQKGNNLTFCSAPNARRQQGQEVCLWVLSGGGLCWCHCGSDWVNTVFVTHSFMPFLAFRSTYGILLMQNHWTCSEELKEQFGLKWIFCRHLLTLIFHGTQKEMYWKYPPS